MPLGQSLFRSFLHNTTGLCPCITGNTLSPQCALLSGGRQISGLQCRALPAATPGQCNCIAIADGCCRNRRPSRRMRRSTAIPRACHAPSFIACYRCYCSSRSRWRWRMGCRTGIARSNAMSCSKRAVSRTHRRCRSSAPNARPTPSWMSDCRCRNTWATYRKRPLPVHWRLAPILCGRSPSARACRAAPLGRTDSIRCHRCIAVAPPWHCRSHPFCSRLYP